jgi:hypothetical protein
MNDEPERRVICREESLFRGLPRSHPAGRGGVNWGNYALNNQQDLLMGIIGIAGT